MNPLFVGGYRCETGDAHLRAWLSQVTDWAAQPGAAQHAAQVSWERVDGVPAPPTLSASWLWRSGVVRGGLYLGRPLFALDSHDQCGAVWFVDRDRALVWGTPVPGNAGWDALRGAAAFELIAWSGSLALHAALIVIDRVGLLVLGPSGAGKSTLVYLASRAGAVHAGDDLVLVHRPENQAWRATGTSLSIRLRPQAWIGADREATADADGKLRLSDPGHRTQRVAQVDGLIALQPQHASASTWRPVASDVMLGHLIGQAALALCPDAADAQLARLRELSRLPAWELTTGADLLEEPERVSDLLRRMSGAVVRERGACT